MSKLVSIVIPVYNAERYLEKCLDSVISQTYQSIEIILINDGSDDNSLEICKQYRENNKNVKLISQKNQGPSVARNNGVSNSLGEYIFFLDSDDQINKYTIEIMMSEIENNKADISICNYKKFSKESKITIAERIDTSIDIYTPYEYYKEILNLKKNTYAWGILMPKSYALENPFPSNRYFEDLFTTYKYLIKSDRIIFIHNPLLFYRSTAGSIVNNLTPKKVSDYYLAMKAMTNDIINIYPDLKTDSNVIKCYAALQIVNCHNIIADETILNSCNLYLDRYAKEIYPYVMDISLKIKLRVWMCSKHLYWIFTRIRKIIRRK